MARNGTTCFLEAGTVLEPDAAARAATVARALQLMAENYYTVPVVELTTVLGVGPTAHDVKFDASSRIFLHDAWKAE
jgi:peptide/nickel transport system substrate-binding protein